ncbi:hypothetical protein I6E11_04780 [Bacteroides caecigallinarum]|uniref:hypothetical protein n=1 Tax=Bacteroides caecigallinarum TaxID=1411144 RepID=UPI001F374C16|nr:hypothetical protein [Bacteroides caecigallinarum]MCF2593118.1 hypothetical protein [Bacteroides caecigallinarum]
MKLKKNIEIEKGPDGYILGGEDMEASEYDMLTPLSDEAAYLIQAIGQEEFDEDTLATMLCSEFGMDYTRALEEALVLMNHWQDIGIIRW